MRWWLGLATASFVGYFALLTWSEYQAREALGFFYTREDSALFLTQVIEGSLVARAGLQAGDRLISASGIPLGNSSGLRVFNYHTPVNRPADLEFIRDGRTQHVETDIPRRVPTVPPAALVFISASMGLSVALGLVIMWRRQRDTTALIGGLLLAGIGCASGPLLPRGTAVHWQRLPLPLGAVLVGAVACSAAVPIFLCVYFARVRRLAIKPGIFWLAMTPGLAIAAYLVAFIVTAIYAPMRAAFFPLPRWFEIVGPLMYPAYFALALGVLTVGWNAIDVATERRRARILLAGTLTGGIALLAVASFLAFRWRLTTTLIAPVTLLYCVMPLSFAYATLRHRLFDLDFIVRLGLQYALARGALVAIVPVALLLLIGDAYVQGDVPLREILGARGWLYGGVAGGAFVIHLRRHAWLSSIDRRFFRERYEAQRVLRHVVDEVSRADSLEAIAGLVLQQIDNALHPRRAALLVKEAGAATFDALAVTPIGAAIGSLPAGGALAGVARALAQPVTLSSDRGGLRRDLPDEAVRWLESSTVELLIPVALDGNGREVLLTLGPRLSEEPYSQEDIDLLRAIAGSLAMVSRLDQPRATGDVAATKAPQTVVGRYRVGRLIGQGGMGTVWEAHDTELDRMVAIKRLKVTADDGIGGIERFRREARAAARLTHPNIVVVHDFGVDTDRHPFLVMERLEGHTLRQRLQSDGALSPSIAVTLAGGIAAGVSAAHAMQLVHRDLKPENVFLAGNDLPATVKILDFGIARSLLVTTSGATSSGAIFGTLLYMAPEQLAGEPPAKSWDLWAMAVMAYEMLAGRHPCETSDQLAFIPALVAGRFDPVRRHVPHAPDAWQRFFDRALALDRSRRPQSAADFADEFARTCSA